MPEQLAYVPNQMEITDASFLKVHEQTHNIRHTPGNKPRKTFNWTADNNDAVAKSHNNALATFYGRDHNNLEPPDRLIQQFLSANLTILTLNVNGAKHCCTNGSTALLDFLQTQPHDVLVLTEVRLKKKDHAILRQPLLTAGYTSTFIPSVTYVSNPR